MRTNAVFLTVLLANLNVYGLQYDVNYIRSSNVAFRPINNRLNREVQAVCGKTNHQRSVRTFKVADGLVALPRQFPWVVALQYRDGSLFCTGTLISQRHVVTAAHCVNQYKTRTVPCQPEEPIDIDDIKVSYGGICIEYGPECPNGRDMLEVEIRQIAYLKNFHKFECMNGDDLAVLELEEDIVFNKNVAPICLDKLERKYIYDFRDIGFGRTEQENSNSVLRQLASKILPQTESNKIISIGFYQAMRSSFPGTLCPGDSGGPLQALTTQNDRTFLLGIHSKSNGCGGTRTGRSTNTYVPIYVDFLCRLTGVCNPKRLFLK